MKTDQIKKTSKQMRAKTKAWQKFHNKILANQNYKTTPILFSTPMVQALLDGRKRMTRRTIKDIDNGSILVDITQPTVAGFSFLEPSEFNKPKDDVMASVIWCPYGQVGDVLWVRETFCRIDYGAFLYKADFDATQKGWKPNIHMPKVACRLFLKVTNVRVERLQDISRGDAMSEGCPFPNIAKETNSFAWFAELWQSINGFKSWNDNPWVWVIEFERCEMPAGFLEGGVK